MANGNIKMYNSKHWLMRQLFWEKKKPEEIAAECGVSHMTIYRKIAEFGIKR